MTNYENIKQMSIDEMAEEISTMSYDLAIKLGKNFVVNDKRSIKQWLESEAEE